MLKIDKIGPAKKVCFHSDVDYVGIWKMTSHNAHILAGIPYVATPCSEYGWSVENIGFFPNGFNGDDRMIEEWMSVKYLYIKRNR